MRLLVHCVICKMDPHHLCVSVTSLKNGRRFLVELRVVVLNKSTIPLAIASPRHISVHGKQSRRASIDINDFRIVWKALYKCFGISIGSILCSGCKNITVILCEGWRNFHRHICRYDWSFRQTTDEPSMTLLTHWGRDKWSPFSRRHFKMHFLEWKCINFD